MTTMLQLGPRDDGRRLRLEEFYASERQEGATYELVRGQLAVSPFPELPQADLCDWIRERLRLCENSGRGRNIDPRSKAWVYGPDDEGPTILRPDLAVYRDLPTSGTKRMKLNWIDLSPYLVVDVLDPGYDEKDLIRNPPLYWTIPSVREYWVLDTRSRASWPGLIVHKRHGGQWVVSTIPYQGTYTTPLVPGFTLLLDPAQE